MHLPFEDRVDVRAQFTPVSPKKNNDDVLLDLKCQSEQDTNCGDNYTLLT